MSEINEESLFLYAAEMLEGGERDRIETELRRAGTEGERALHRARDAHAHLALVVDAVEPPDGARQAVIDRAVRERARARPRLGSRGRSGPPRVLSPSSSPAARPGRWAALAAGLLLAVAAGFGLGQWRLGDEREVWVQRTRDLEGRQLALAAESRQALAVADGRIRALERRLADALAAGRSTDQDLARAEAELARSRAEVAQQAETLARTRAGTDERVRALEGEVARLEEQVAALAVERAELVRTREAHAVSLAAAHEELEHAGAVLAMLEQEGLAELELVAPGDGGVAHASLLWELDDRLCYMRAWQLARVDDGYRYALWVEDEGGRVDLIGTFVPDADGRASYFGRLPGDEGRLGDSFVTLEHAPVAASPQGPRVLGVPRDEPKGKRRPGPYDRRRRSG